MSRYPYSSEYLPAAPVVEIRLGAPGTESSSDLMKAFVDSGADATMVPMAQLRQVRAKKVDRAALRSQWGERRAVTLYAVALEINQYHFSAIRVVGDEIKPGGGDIIGGAEDVRTPAGYAGDPVLDGFEEGVCRVIRVGQLTDPARARPVEQDRHVVSRAHGSRG